MAKITGFRLADRWAGWDQAPFTSDSPRLGGRIRETRLISPCSALADARGGRKDGTRRRLGLWLRGVRHPSILGH